MTIQTDLDSLKIVFYSGSIFFSLPPSPSSMCKCKFAKTKLDTDRIIDAMSTYR